MRERPRTPGAPAPSTLLPLAAAALLACAAAACAGPGGADPGPGPPAADGAPAVPPPPLPWTSRFQEEAVLVADEIRVEGPPGLMDHVVLRQEPAVVDYRVRTVPEGLLQELTLREGGALGELRGQLDNWALVAFRRLSVLERPNEGPITVRAEGRAAWISPDGTEERRPRLEFVAERED